MSLDEGLVRLFDNISSMEMAEMGVQRGVVDVYAVEANEANEVLVSQLTQTNVVGGVGTVDNVDVGTTVGASGTVGGAVGTAVGASSGNGTGMGKGKGKTEAKANAKPKANAVGNSKGKVVSMNMNTEKGTEKVTDKGSEKGKLGAADGVRVQGVAEDVPADDPSFVDSDYDLSDHDEDAIMAVQVEGWKKVMDVMETHSNDHIGSTSDMINFQVTHQVQELKMRKSWTTAINICLDSTRKQLISMTRDRRLGCTSTARKTSLNLSVTKECWWARS